MITRSRPRTARPRSSSPAVLAVLVAAITAFSLIQSLIMPVLLPLARHLGTDQGTIGWLLTAYLVSASVLTPILGRLGDIWGKDRILVVALVLLSLGCLVSALAPSVGWAIAGRVVQGAGGGVLPVAFGIVRDELPPRRVAAAIGFLSSLLAFGVGIGVVLAGPLVDLLGYSWVFWLPCLVGAGAAIAAAVVIPRSPTRTGERIGLLPAVLMATWLTLLLVGISQAPQWGWTSPAVLALLAGAAIAGLGWVRAESRAEVPLVDLAMLRHRSLWTSNAVAFAVGFGLYSSGVVIAQFAQSPPEEGFGFGMSVTGSGLLMLPSSVLSFVAGLAAAPLAKRLGGRLLVVVGCLSVTAGAALFVVAHDGEVALYVVSALTGLGFGLALTTVANLVVAAVPARQTGVASGTNANVRTIGGAIGTAVVASLLAAGTSPGAPAESGYVMGVAVIGVVLLLGAVVGLAIPSTSADRVTPSGSTAG